MFLLGEVTQFPWLLSTSGSGLALFLFGTFLLSKQAGQEIGRVYPAAFLSAVCLLVAAAELATSDSPPYVFLGTWDMSGPDRPWKNLYLKPLETNGVAVVELKRVGSITYREESGHLGDLVGPFVSSNQFAACIGMTLPVLIGLLFWLVPFEKSKEWQPNRQLGVWLFSAAIWSLGVVSLSYYCQSWAGTAAFLLGTVFTLGLTARKASRARKVLWSLGILGLVASLLMFLALANWVPIPDVLHEPLQSARSSAGHRINAWRYALDSWWQEPLTGIGWGNYRYCQPDTAQDCFYFTHNDYLQLAAETGLAGIGVLTIFLIYLLVRMIRTANTVELGRDRFLILGACAGIVTIALHSLLDFNLRVPLNALVLAVLLGMLLSSGKKRATLLGKYGATGAALFLITAGIWIQWGQLQRDSQLLAINSGVMRMQCANDAAELHSAEQQLIKTMQDYDIREARSVQEAVICGKAHLHLSHGTQYKQLLDSAKWFQRAIALYPRVADRKTLAKIRGVLKESAQPMQ